MPRRLALPLGGLRLGTGGAPDRRAHLAPGTQQRILALLAGDARQDLVAASTWADDIVAQRPETGPWHFVNIPEAEAAYSASRDCPGDACTVAQVARWRAVLAAPEAVPGAPPGRRAEALKFLVSLVADLHQPLHAACRPLGPRRHVRQSAVPCGADPHGDRGADELKVRFGDLGVSLHHVWDHELFYGETGTLSAVADRLAAEVTSGQRREWASGTVEDWVNQTHALAREVAYGLLPKGPRVVIPLRYEAEARKTVELQMKRAGVRLAAVLTEALTEPADRAPIEANR
jgi:nuclease S1